MVRSELETTNSSGLTLGQVFRNLQSHVWFILPWALLCLLGCALYLHFRQPAFRATATLRIDSGRAQSLGVGEAATGAPVDESNVIQTEIGVLESNRVLKAALRSLPDADFAGITGSSRANASTWSDDANLTPAQAKILHAVQTRITVAPVTGTQLVNVSYTGRNAQLATSMVDHLITAYETESLESRKESVGLLQTWFTHEIEQLRVHVDTSQRKLAQFQENNGILSTSDASNTTIDKLRLLSDRLTQAQADRILKEGQLRAARGGSPQVLMSLYPDPSFAELEAEQAKVEAAYTQMAAKFDSKYPPRVQLEHQLNALNAELNKRSRSVLNRLATEYESANNVQTMLQKQYDEQLSAAYAQNRNAAQNSVLLAQVTSDRDLLNALQTKLQQAMLNAEVTGINVVLVDHASVPLDPAGPSAAIILGGGLLLGLFTGAAASFFAEATTDRVNRVEQLQHSLASPVFACIPSQTAGAKTGASRTAALSADAAKSSRSDAHAKAFRGVRNRLLLHFGGETHKTVLVAGAAEHEGVDAAATQLAWGLAHAGFTALLVDTNPSHGTPRTIPMLSAQDNRSGVNLLPEPGQVKHVPLVSLFVAGQDDAEPFDDLASPSFRRALEHWSADFDFTILIGAPLLKSNDSLLLAGGVDAVLLVTQYRRTRLSALARLRQLLNEAGAATTGALLVGAPWQGNEAG